MTPLVRFFSPCRSNTVRMSQSIVVVGSSNIGMVAQMAQFRRPGETIGDAVYSQAYAEAKGLTTQSVQPGSAAT